jgi:aminotransferase
MTTGLVSDSKRKKPNSLVSLPSPSKMAGSIELSMIKRMQLMAAKDPEVITLAQGIPSFETPEHICLAAKKAIDMHVVDKYTPGYGMDSLREAVAHKVSRTNGITADSSQILITHGGIEALMVVLMTLLNPDDQLIILTPDYASHITQSQIVANGQMPIFVPLTETAGGWTLDAK